MFKGLIDWYMATLKTGGYPIIGLLMAIESSIVPLPSELIIPPAAHLAHTGQIPLSLTGIIIAGTIGSWIGATAMYWAARLAGRATRDAVWRLCADFTQKSRGSGTLGRALRVHGGFHLAAFAGVRHLIGIPAGIVRMDYRAFSIFTLLGSAVWCGVLCYVGIKMGQDEQLMKGELHRITIWLGGAMLILGGMYYSRTSPDEEPPADALAERQACALRLRRRPPLAVAAGQAPDSTGVTGRSIFSVPRMMVRSERTPIWSPVSSRWSASIVEMGWPLRATITSPSRNPAPAAGLPEAKAITKTPLAAGN